MGRLVIKLDLITWAGCNLDQAGRHEALMKGLCILNTVLTMRDDAGYFGGYLHCSTFGDVGFILSGSIL